MIAAMLMLAMAGCARPEGGVANKVLQDFGLKSRPEGYVSGADRVYERLDQVGAVELKRMNQKGRHGEIAYEEADLRGLYYKKVKIYERFFPLDAHHVSRTSSDNDARAYSGYVEYAYRIFESPRKPTRTEAQAETASIPTEETGRESYRYTFSTGGNWNGEAGERARR